MCDCFPGVLCLATRGHCGPLFCVAASPWHSWADQGPNSDTVGVGGIGADGLDDTGKAAPPGARGEAEAWSRAHSLPPCQVLWVRLYPTTGRKGTEPWPLPEDLSVLDGTDLGPEGKAGSDQEKRK